MELLQRYLFQVEKHLSLFERKDTIAEMKSILLDQIDSLIESGLSEKDAEYKAIKDFGGPRKVAYRYRQSPPLVSDKLEPIMFDVFKAILLIIPLIVLIVKVVTYVTNDDPLVIMDLLLTIAYALPSVMSTVFSSLIFTFVAFVIADRYFLDQIDLDEIIFEPGNLPKMPIDNYKISIFGSIAEILGTVFLLYILNLNEGIITISNNGIEELLFNENFTELLVFVNAGLITNLVLIIVDLYKRRKTFITKTLDFITGIYVHVIIILIAASDVVNQVLIDAHNLNNLVRIISFIIVLSSIFSIIVESVKYIKVFKK